MLLIDFFSLDDFQSIFFIFMIDAKIDLSIGPFPQQLGQLIIIDSLWMCFHWILSDG